MSLMYPKPERLELPIYRAFIRQHPCVVQKCWRRTEASHVVFDGQGRASSKVQDTQCVPKCRPHHEEFGRIGRLAFELKYGLNLYQIIIDLLSQYIVLQMQAQEL